MEIKLFVRTHKENFGSVLLFSNNMIPKEKRIMEDIKYTKYEPDETEIIEISVPGFYIYFCTYIGGQDEYGRDYQNVIGTLFPFRISEGDVLNLQKTFKDIMNDISSNNFSEDNRYFSEIKVKANYKQHSKTYNRFWKINLKHSFVFLFLISALSFAGYKFKDNFFSSSSLNKEVKIVAFDRNLRNSYSDLMKSIYKEKDSAIKYRLYKELQTEFDKSAHSIIQTESERRYNEIITEYGKNQKDNTALAALVEEYLTNSDFQYNIKKIKEIKKEIQKGNELSFFKNIELKIENFNKNPDNDKLTELVSACKDSLPMLSAKEKKYIHSILAQTDAIYNGINTDVEVHISDKSAVFNRRTFGFEIKPEKQSSQFKSKQMNSNPDIYACSFLINLSPLSKTNFKIYDYSYSGKKILLKEMSLNFNSFNKPVLITDNNGSSFKIEVRLIFDKFKIKVNN